jgi:plastocyanin
MIGMRIKNTSSLIPSLNLSATQVSGVVVVPYTPTAQYGGIFLYSKVMWGIGWVGLFFALRHRHDMGTIRTWLLFFLISLGVGTMLAVASLDWSQLTTVMQLSSNESQITRETPTGTTIMNEISIKIPEGSSIQGNPSYEPYSVVVNKDDLITWVNADTAPHTVTSGAGIDDVDSGKFFDSGSLGQGQKLSISAEQLVEEEGGANFDYYCTVHPFMKGKLTVT